MNIFVYGSLMDREIMNHASGSDPIGEKAVLPDFGRYQVKNVQYPGMRKEQGNQVDGLLYLDVGPDAVNRLDIFEGDMYTRMEVEVRLEEKNEVRRAMAYVVNDEYVHTLSSSGWSFEEFLATGKPLFTAGYHGFEDLEKTVNAKNIHGKEGK